MSGSATVRFCRQLARDMPGPAAAAVGLALVVAAGEAASVLILARLLALAGVAVDGGPAGALARAVDRLLGAVGLSAELGPVLLLFVGVTLVQALARRADSLVAHRMELQTGLRLRTRLFDAVAGARWLPLARLRGTDLLTALTGEADRVGAGAGHAATLLAHALMAVAYLAFALRVSAPITAVAFACGAVLLLLQSRFRRNVRAAGEALSTASAALTSAAGEHLGALKVVKSYGAEDRNAALFAGTARRAAEAREQAWRAFADSSATFSVGAVGLLALVTYLALSVLQVPGATVLLLVFLFSRLVPRLSYLQGLHHMMSRELPAWERLTAMAQALEAEREDLEPAHERVELAHSIRIEGVSFGYEAARGDALADVGLQIEARRTTAVVGPSGSGKTTLADLVMGLVRPRAGHIRVDGRTLDESWLRAWREGIGYVAQDTVLFNDTVLANLRWARPEASDDEVREALRLSVADGFVAALPDGLHTILGDRGVRLSGGERQRLALARALLRRPALLILDEATSALDAENERRIREAIRGLHGRMTILMITHRLPSVRDADVIHVMEAGRLVETGSFATLMGRPEGRFRRLWASQSGELDLADPPAS
ncbi:MAG TPA: ABC transporter ATP-binding protein [Longimicrobium sp.]|uniref:ABC transporter ATP-binding protein n=1 Tax=Longimicrobium sp. TaxID=2029185 RepID=UPI002EDBB6B3